MTISRLSETFLSDEGPRLETLRPVYTGDFCCDLSPFDACD